MRCRRCRPVPEEVRRAADLLERRWTISILYASYDGATRFNEFRQALGPISPATLAARLVELEQAGGLQPAGGGAPPPPRPCPGPARRRPPRPGRGPPPPPRG